MSLLCASHTLLFYFNSTLAQCFSYSLLYMLLDSIPNRTAKVFTHQAANSSNAIRLGVCVAVSANIAALVQTAPSSTARVSSSADRLELAKLRAMRAVRNDRVYLQRPRLVNRSSPSSS